jgi:hypothetical protein
MARYKDYDYSQGKFIPIHFDRQVLPGTYEYSLHYLIDNEIDIKAEPIYLSREAKSKHPVGAPLCGAQSL